jgi:hypothetical protein
MLIIAIPTSPYGNPSDRLFKTVPAALRFMIRSFFEQAGDARQVEIYEWTAPVVRINFTGKDQLVLTSGNIEGWEPGSVKTLDEAIALTKMIHRS